MNPNLGLLSDARKVEKLTIRGLQVLIVDLHKGLEAILTDLQ